MSKESLKAELSNLQAQAASIRSDMATSDRQGHAKARLMDIEIKIRGVQAKLNATESNSKPEPKADAQPSKPAGPTSKEKKLAAALKGIEDRYGRKK